MKNEGFFVKNKFLYIAIPLLALVLLTGCDNLASMAFLGNKHKGGNPPAPAAGSGGSGPTTTPFSLDNTVWMTKFTPAEVATTAYTDTLQHFIFPFLSGHSCDGDFSNTDIVSKDASDIDDATILSHCLPGATPTPKNSVPYTLSGNTVTVGTGASAVTLTLSADHQTMTYPRGTLYKVSH